VPKVIAGGALIKLVNIHESNVLVVVEYPVIFVTFKLPAILTLPFAERSEPATNLLENVFTPATVCAVVKST